MSWNRPTRFTCVGFKRNIKRRSDNAFTEIIFSFIQVGLFSVGGGYAAIPLIQEQIVNIHHLMTMEEFSDLITVAEMTPGPISINSSTFVGMRIAGIGGVALFARLYHSVICHMLYTRVFLL